MDNDPPIPVSLAESRLGPIAKQSPTDWEIWVGRRCLICCGAFLAARREKLGRVARGAPLEMPWLGSRRQMKERYVPASAPCEAGTHDK